jgi:hypothetical protein
MEELNAEDESSTHDNRGYGREDPTHRPFLAGAGAIFSSLDLLVEAIKHGSTLLYQGSELGEV